MPRQSVSIRISTTLEGVLGQDVINELGRATGQSQRLRVVTPHRLLVTLLSAMGTGKVETIADLCRSFNFQHNANTAYKAFYNRLGRPQFVVFMRAVVSRLLEQLAVRTLRPAADSPLAQFRDILVHDGSSFALKAALRDVFPGRFKAFDPAAVELHATLSGFADEVAHVQVAPDTTHERAFLPAPHLVAGALLLADRGYPSFNYFSDVENVGGHWLMRMSRSNKPYVTAIHDGQSVTHLAEPTPLEDHLATSDALEHDLDIELRRGRTQRLPCRMVVRPGKAECGLWLCTNLPRQRFPDDLVVRLYRFRWQVELLFKEWKSYANLRKFDTGNPHIAEGLIWASLAAAILKRFLAHAVQRQTRRPISTRKVAMCAPLFLQHLLAAIDRPALFRSRLQQAVDFLEDNARRASPGQERQTGRLSAGLEVCLAA